MTAEISSEEAGASFACLYIRDFLIALACRERGLELALRPVVLCSVPGEQAEVRACSRAAMIAGVTPGMTLQRALAICREAVLLPYKEADALETALRITGFLRGVSPAVEVLEPGHVHFEMRGLATLAGMDDESYLGDLATLLHNLTGLAISLGASSTLFSAHAAALDGATQGRSVVYQVVRSPRDFLRSLPLEMLPVSEGMHERLRQLGMSTLGDLSGLSLPALQAQFGLDGARVWRLARGECDARIRVEPEAISVRAEIDLPAPMIELGPVVTATRILLQRVFDQADTHGRAARKLEWELTLESGELLARRFVFREPTRDMQRILALVRSRLEQIALTAPAIRLALVLEGFCCESTSQPGLWASGPRQRRNLLDALAQVRTRAGMPLVYQVIEVQPWSRIPERRLALAPYDH